MKQVILFVVFFVCLNCFCQISRYVYDENMIGRNFMEFAEIEKNHVKIDGYMPLFGNNRRYLVALQHNRSGYNRMYVYVNEDNIILKTCLFTDNEIIPIGKDEEWMMFAHVDRGEYVKGVPKPEEKKNWFERQCSVAYDEFVPSMKTVDVACKIAVTSAVVVGAVALAIVASR